MAGDWIKMRCDLSEDPAVISMADALGLDEFAVVGRLHRLWSWASQHTKDGRASVTEKRIDFIVTHQGFARSMERVGWLEINETHVLFVRFNRHNSKSAKARALDSSRKKRVRKMSGSHPDKNRTGTGQKPDQRREEKRREDLGNEFPKNPSCSEPENPAAEPTTFPVFQCNGKRKVWTLTDQMLAEFAGTYPGIDVPAHARAAWQWLKANPERRKTFNGMSRFLNAWLAKEQNRAGATKPKPVSRVATLEDLANYNPYATD